MRQSALFLDRDGVINQDSGYVYRREDIEFVDGIFDLVAAANLSGMLVVIVTNQAGIGRGLYTEADFHRLMSWMAERFIEQGCRIDAVYFSPYHPEHGIGEYKRVSHCRKPAPGMLLRAVDELRIDLPSSILIGDRLTDLQAGDQAGVGTLIQFVPDGHCELHPPQGGDGVHRPHAMVINSLRAAIPYLRSE